MQNPSTADLAHVVVHHEVVGRGLEVADLQVVVELRHVRHARRRVGVGPHLDRRPGERLGRAHREAVGGEAPAEVVEQRADPHDVGVQHEPGDGHAVGPGVDRVDGRAVGPLEHDVLDVDFAAFRAVSSAMSHVAFEDRGLGQAGQAVLDGAGPDSPTPSTSSRSASLARMIFCRFAKRSTMWSDTSSGSRGILCSSR